MHDIEADINDDLDSVFNRAESILELVERVSRRGAAMPTKVLYGAIGFIGGGTITGAALFALDATTFLIAGVPIGALLGMCSSILLTRSNVDQHNERATEVTETAWLMREREIDRINRQLKEIRASSVVDEQLEINLVGHLAWLSTASPLDLQQYFDLRVNNRTIAAKESRSDRLLPRQPELPALTDQSKATSSALRDHRSN